MEIGKIITINSRKYDWRIYKSWKAELVEFDNSLLVLVGVFDKEVNHQDLGTIRLGTISHEYYWLDKWFNIFHFQEPDGTFRNFYCNINIPPKFENDVLDYVDLDIDILVERDLSFKVLDFPEFEQNSQIYNYPPKIILQTQKVLDELKSMILAKEFPFSQICKSPLTY